MPAAMATTQLFFCLLLQGPPVVSLPLSTLYFNHPPYQRRQTSLFSSENVLQESELVSGILKSSCYTVASVSCPSVPENMLSNLHSQFKRCLLHEAFPHPSTLS